MMKHYFLFVIITLGIVQQIILVLPGLIATLQPKYAYLWVARPSPTQCQRHSSILYLYSLHHHLRSRSNPKRQFYADESQNAIILHDAFQARVLATDAAAMDAGATGGL